MLLKITRGTIKWTENFLDVVASSIIKSKIDTCTFNSFNEWSITLSMNRKSNVSPFLFGFNGILNSKSKNSLQLESKKCYDSMVKKKYLCEKPTHSKLEVVLSCKDNLWLISDYRLRCTLDGPGFSCAIITSLSLALWPHSVFSCSSFYKEAKIFPCNENERINC